MNTCIAAFRSELRRIAGNGIDRLVLTLLPLVLLGAMAAMISGGTPRDLPVMIVDQDGGPLAREVARNIAAVPSLHLVGRTPDREQAMSLMRSEEIVAFVVIPRGVSQEPVRDSPVEVFYEAVFLSTGSLASTYLRVVIAGTLAAAAPRELGIGGAGVAERALPGVQVSLLGNPTLSLEWYLGMLIGPSVLHLLIAISCVGSIGALMRGGSFAAFARASRRPIAVLVGRLTVHVVAGVLWGIAWLLWMTLARGYRIEGSIGAIVVGLVLLFWATAAVALLFVAVTREVSTSLSAAVIVAGSALAYSGATLPLTGGLWFAQRWSELLPLTHFIRLQMDQLIGATPVAALSQFGALLLYPLFAGGLGTALILWTGRRG